MEYGLLCFFGPLVVLAGLLIWFCFRQSGWCKSTKDFFRSAIRDDRGLDTVEGALLLGFVALGGAAIVLAKAGRHDDTMLVAGSICAGMAVLIPVAIAVRRYLRLD